MTAGDPDGFDDFSRGWSHGQPQVVIRRLVDDLETPVSAFLKVGHGRIHAFLLESVEGGAVNGRYSIITREPDLVWRCRSSMAEVASARRRWHRRREWALRRAWLMAQRTCNLHDEIHPA